MRIKFPLLIISCCLLLMACGHKTSQKSYQAYYNFNNVTIPTQVKQLAKDLKNKGIPTKDWDNLVPYINRYNQEQIFNLLSKNGPQAKSVRIKINLSPSLTKKLSKIINLTSPMIWTADGRPSSSFTTSLQVQRTLLNWTSPFKMNFLISSPITKS